MTCYVFFEDKLLFESKALPDISKLPLASYMYNSMWANRWVKIIFNQSYQKGMMINTDEDDVPPQYRALALLLT